MIISLAPKIYCYHIASNSFYAMQSYSKFMNYFFDDINLNILNGMDENLDGCVYCIQDIDNIVDRKLNIILCVENCSAWDHYKHYNAFGNYGDERIKIYLYNHIYTIYETDKLIAIPVIYLQMNYFNKFYNTIKPSNIIPFEQKKFCLIATRITNDYKQNVYNILTSIDSCDNIADYKELIEDKSCYHDVALLNLFNQYKFVFNAENSINDGYITEKIFNCFFARTIPIYYGSDKIENFFNKDTFINANNNGSIDLNNLIRNIKDNETLYNKYFESNIINENYNDENYKDRLNNFIKKIDV
jgi:hypothetical protein